MHQTTQRNCWLYHQSHNLDITLIDLINQTNGAGISWRDNERIRWRNYRKPNIPVIKWETTCLPTEHHKNTHTHTKLYTQNSRTLCVVALFNPRGLERKLPQNYSKYTHTLIDYMVRPHLQRDRFIADNCSVVANGKLYPLSNRRHCNFSTRNGVDYMICGD